MLNLKKAYRWVRQQITLKQTLHSEIVGLQRDVENYQKMLESKSENLRQAIVLKNTYFDNWRKEQAAHSATIANHRNIKSSHGNAHSIAG
jgi:hypothetical protein